MQLSITAHNMLAKPPASNLAPLLFKTRTSQSKHVKAANEILNDEKPGCNWGKKTNMCCTFLI